MAAMGSYDIDHAAVIGIITTAEAQLSALAGTDREAQADIDAVETALGVSRVAAAFTEFADNVLMKDIKAAVFGAENAVHGTRRAVHEYLKGDSEMMDNVHHAAAGIPRPMPGQIPAVARGRWLQ
jgi:hypothetical protein